MENGESAGEQPPPEEGGQKKENTTSNLPLLFANGYPTSLELITQSQLVKFIPFMVNCSVGRGNFQADDEEGDAAAPAAVPVWWPEDLAFALPPVRPANKSEDEWVRLLKEAVCSCYAHHKNVFLLRFCTVLAQYQPECLRFINNYNSTTSLYDRLQNKLLVTFRNENMLYDREPSQNRICLLPRRRTGALPDAASPDEAAEEDLGGPSMVEPPLFDIYLCDYCDAELYSLEACREHERSCREASEQGAGEDSDVVLCEDGDAAAPSSIVSAIKRRARRRAPDREERERELKPQRRKRQTQQELVPSSEADEEEEEDDDDDNEAVAPAGDEKMRVFMSHFQLVTAKGNPADNWPQKSLRKHQLRSPAKAAAEKGRRGRSDRNVLTLQRCATVPLSSPMGHFLLRSQKTVLGRDYVQERIERLERFCPAPVIRDSVWPRWMSGSAGGAELPVPVTYRAIDYRGMFTKEERFDSRHVHRFRWPRRQLSQRSRDLAWHALAQILLLCCRPCSVGLVRLTQSDIRMYFLHLAIERKKRELMELRRADLVRLLQQQGQRQMKRCLGSAECIDLCSSDEEDGEPDNAKRLRLADDDKEEKENCSALARVPPKCGASTTHSQAPNDAAAAPSHSALQPKAGPLFVATAIAPTQLLLGSWKTALIAGNSVPVSSAAVGPLGARPANQSPSSGQPSSYLFLTKQQLLYQQPDSVAESRVAQANEVERQVVSGTPSMTNSSLGGCTQPVQSTTTKELSGGGGKASPRESRESPSGLRPRRSSGCEPSSCSLPKKMPSLIRIAPTVSGE